MTRKLREWIRQHIHPLEIYQTYVQLKPSGKNWVGLCPFHHEKTPSFYFFTDSIRFYCFGCKKSGDEVDFLQSIEHLDISGVIEILQQRWSIPPPPWKTASPEDEAARVLREILTRAHEYYRSMLAKPRASEARKYLESRGLSPETWVHYGLGYAPNETAALWQAISNTSAYPEWSLKQSGLWVERDGRMIDFFRHRIIFPIHDRSGRLMALAGRALDPNFPKYLNSRETILFRKSQSFFGLGWALKAIRETREAILVEGYFDALLLHQHGYPNTLAILGSHLSAENARWIATQCDRVRLAFDGDDAGMQAALESIRFLAVYPVEIRVVILPEGTDPADMMETDHGRTRFRRLMEQAWEWPAFFVHTLRKMYGARPLENPKALNVVFDFIEVFYRESDVRAMAMTDTLAEHFRLLSGRQLYRDFLRHRRKRGRGEEPEPTKRMTTPPREPTYEYYLIAGLMNEPARFEQLLEDVGRDLFRFTRFGPVYEWLLEAWYNETALTWEDLLEQFQTSPLYHDLVMIHQLVEGEVEDEHFELCCLFLHADYYRRAAARLFQSSERDTTGEAAQTVVQQRRYELLRRAVEIETRIGKHRLSSAPSRH